MSTTQSSSNNRLIHFQDSLNIYEIDIDRNRVRIGLTLFAGEPPERVTVFTDTLDIGSSDARMKFRLAVEMELQKRPGLAIDASRIDAEMIELASIVAERKRSSSGEHVHQATGDPLSRLVDPEPWPEPVNGSGLLDKISDVFRRHIVAAIEAVYAMALWVAYTYCHDCFDTSGMLVLQSGVEQCGKTTTLTVLDGLVRKAIATSNITPAALFRLIDECGPTLLIDEADTFLKIDPALRGIINSGHTRATAYVVRSVGDDHKPYPFSTWCPKVIALIGNLAPTLEDRSIVIHMERSLPGQRSQKVPASFYGESDSIRRMAARWAADLSEQLQVAAPTLPEALTTYRSQDVWLPLIAIADLAGGEWPTRARSAAINLYGTGERGSESKGIMLLRDLRDDVLGGKPAEYRISTKQMVRELTELEGRPWLTYHRGKPLSDVALAAMLRGFGIGPTKWRDKPSRKHLRGYVVKAFADAFRRYLGGAEPPQPPNARNDGESRPSAPPQPGRPAAGSEAEKTSEDGPLAAAAGDGPGSHPAGADAPPNPTNSDDVLHAESSAPTPKQPKLIDKEEIRRREEEARLKDLERQARIRAHQRALKKKSSGD